MKRLANRCVRPLALCPPGAALLLALSLPALAAAATSGYDLLRTDPTVRGASLGGRPVALPHGELSSLEINPAGLALIEGREVEVLYADHPLDIAAGRLASSYPVLGGQAAASLTWMNYGSFERRTDVGEESEGSFSPSDLLLTLGYSRTLAESLAVGGALKAVRGEIDGYTSGAVALDVGVLWATGWEGVALGAGVFNAGVPVSDYSGVSERLPLRAALGISKQLAHLPLRLLLTGHGEPLDGAYFATAGGEFTVSPLLRLRAAYTSRAGDYHVDSDQDSFAGISAGLSLTHGRLRLDYGFHTLGALGGVHRLGFTARL